MLTNLFISLGWSRDDKKWIWLQIVAVAGLVSSNVFDVPYWAAYLHIPLSTVVLHWVLTLAALITWVAGKYNSSPLPSAQAMSPGSVPGSPSSPLASDGGRKLGVILLAAVLGAGTVTSGCASAAARHPLLDPVGQATSYALDALTIAEGASAALKTQVDNGTLKMGQSIADSLNVLSAVGDACKDIGVLLDAYNRAAAGVAKIKAQAALAGKIAALDSLVQHMPKANIEKAAKDLAAKVTQLKGAGQ